MQYVNLGASGLKVSRIALGMMTFGTPTWRPWVLGEDDARAIVRRAVELGINVFDTADMYSAGMSEEITGRLVREFAVRDEAVVATKVYMPVDLAFSRLNSPGPKPTPRPNMQGLSRKRILAAADASLLRLGLDWIDLYQIHRFDPTVPVEETMGTLHDLVRAGKVRYLGASSMWAWQFAKMQQVAREHGWTPFVAMQSHYNLLYREEEREMIPLCVDQGVGVLPWSPLARGFLAGNRGRDDKAAGATTRAQTDEIAQRFYYQDSDFAVADALSAVARARGEPMAKVAYAWLLGRRGVSAPIVGATKTWQLDEAVAAASLSLSAAEVAALESAYRPHPVLGHA
jgi:aryl-alcohol dehydrogenase (NADP+)